VTPPLDDNDDAPHPPQTGADDKQARRALAKARFKETARFLPNLIKLAARLARDNRVPRSRKAGLALLAGYLACPFDLIPDFIPVIGVADDVILVAVTLRWVAQAVPRPVVLEHWDGETDLFALLDKVQAVINGLRRRPAREG